MRERGWPWRGGELAPKWKGRGLLLPGVRRTLDRREGPPTVRNITAPRLANSCHLPKDKALTPNMLPGTSAPHRFEHTQANGRDLAVTCWQGPRSRMLKMQLSSGLVMSATILRTTHSTVEDILVCVTSLLMTWKIRSISDTAYASCYVKADDEHVCAAPTRRANRYSWCGGRLDLYSMRVHK